MPPLSPDEFWIRLKQISDYMEIESNTFDQWHHRGYIPPSRHYEMVGAAIVMGLTGITHEKLHNQWKEAKRNK